MFERKTSACLVVALVLVVSYVAGVCHKVFAQGYDCSTGCQTTYACGSLDQRNNCFVIAFQTPTCLNCCTGGGGPTQWCYALAENEQRGSGPCDINNGVANDNFVGGYGLSTCDYCGGADYTTLHEVAPPANAKYNMLGTRAVCEGPY
jgi:hypothetical protein